MPNRSFGDVVQIGGEEGVGTVETACACFPIVGAGCGGGGGEEGLVFFLGGVGHGVILLVYGMPSCPSKSSNDALPLLLEVFILLLQVQVIKIIILHKLKNY